MDSHHHECHLYRLQPNRDRNPLLKYNGLKRKISSLLIQMRTGEIALNKFLSSVDKSNTDRYTLWQLRRGLV